MTSQENQNTSARGRVLRLLAAAPAILLCLWAIWSAGGAGLSRLFSYSASVTGDAQAAAQAVSLAPADAEAHFALGLASSSGQALADAVREYERAIALRPRDYYLWFMLADARDQVGDQNGALAASREAVRLAPFYAQPRWQLGNLLFRAGQQEEAFAELRRASTSDPALLPAVIDLAWGSNHQDAQSLETVIQPQTKAARLALARFLAQHGKTADAVNYFRAAGEVSEKEKAALLNELLAARKFREAYEIWLSGSPAPVEEKGSGDGSLIDGGFEKRLAADNVVFGWQLSRESSYVSFAIDSAERREGARSLQLNWKGDSNPATPILGQLVLVQPKTQYRLRFSARTQELVTGGPPVFIIRDMSNGEERVLAQSKPLPQGNSPWTDYSLEFTTGNETSAVSLSLQRLGCGGGPCPIFGRLWLDGLSLQKI